MLLRNWCRWWTLSAMAVVFLACLLHCCAAAPTSEPPRTHGGAHHTQTQKVRKFGGGQRRGKNIWWENPCRVMSKRSSDEVPNKDTEKKTEEWRTRWVQQLQTTIHYLQDIMPRKINLDPSLLPSYDHPWLPNEAPKKVPTRKLSHEFNPDHDNKDRDLVKKLYNGLQRFAVTLECMLREKHCRLGIKKNMPPVRNHQKRSEQTTETPQIWDDVTERNNTLQDIKNKLAMLLCEVKEVLEQYEVIPLPRAPTSKIIRDHPDKWVVTRDNTFTMSQDFGVLSRYSKYLSEWKEVAYKLFPSERHNLDHPKTHSNHTTPPSVSDPPRRHSDRPRKPHSGSKPCTKPNGCRNGGKKKNPSTRHHKTSTD